MEGYLNISNGQEELFAFAEEMGKKLPLLRREEFLFRFKRYTILYQKAKNHPAEETLAQECEKFGAWVKLKLHAALTGDIDSDNGVDSGKETPMPKNQQEKDYLEKRHQELARIKEFLDSYAEKDDVLQEKVDIKMM